MKKYITLMVFAVCLIGCKQKHNDVHVQNTVEDARNFVAASFNSYEETLILSDELLDPTGLNMAIIMDGILAKGYMPEDLEQKDGYWVYTFTRDSI